MSKKKAGQTDKNKPSNQQTVITDKLKYEVAQEMGISPKSPKTKNKKS